jgi:hypothetical protein
MSSSSLPPAYKPLSPADLDQLIGEVAKHHGFLLDRDDPVLVTVSLNKLVLAQLISQIEQATGAAKLDIAAGAARQTEAAKIEASHLITAAAEYADQQFRLAAIDAAEELKSGLQKELGEVPLVAGAEQLARTASFVRWASAFVYLAATVVALIAIIIPLAFPSSPVTAHCIWSPPRAAQR